VILFRVFIENKAVINRAYWAESPTEQELADRLSEITDVFPNETFPYPPAILGKDLYNNVSTLHQCSPDNNSAVATKIQGNLLLDKDFIRYIYDLDTNTKTYEIFYKDDAAYSMQPLGAGLTVYRISDMFDADMNTIGKQSVYVQGSNEDVFAWANSLNPNIAMPISVDKELHPDDSYKFEFNTNRELVSVQLFAHLTRTMVWNAEGTETYVEYTADYADELTNLADTEIVIPRYNENGFRIASDPNR
tara:strand:- start:1659 stop:2402 length:744 start_codon:yes stop_codon:yes gene_type:complete